MLNFCDFIQVYVFTTNHHLNANDFFLTQCILIFSLFSVNDCILINIAPIFSGKECCAFLYILFKHRLVCKNIS